MGENSMYKRVVLIGRARVGKSRICSRFCKNGALITKYFTGAGRDFTSVNIRFIIKRECKDEGNIIKFISPESSLNGVQYNLDEEGITLFLNKINHYNTYAKSHVEKSGLKKN